MNHKEMARQAAERKARAEDKFLIKPKKEDKKEKTFEEHPAFHKRLKIVGRDAFVTRGPEEPQVGSESVRKRGTPFIYLPEQPEERRWYVLQLRGAELGLAYPPKKLDEFLDMQEAQATEQAMVVLTELGLDLPDSEVPPGCSIGPDGPEGPTGCSCPAAIGHEGESGVTGAISEEKNND